MQNNIRNLSFSTSPPLTLYILAVSMIASLNHQVLCSIDIARVEENLTANASVLSHKPHYHHHRHHQAQEYLKHQHPCAKEQLSSSSSDPLRLTAQPLKTSDSRQLRNKCLVAERELDRCSAQLIGLGSSSSSMYPDSMQELDSVYCPRFRETVSCIKNNTECYKPFERQIINWVLTSTRKMNHKRCKNEKEKIRFLKLTNSCFSSMRYPMDQCMSNYIGSLDAIADYDHEIERLGEDDFQIQLSCCANRRFKQCVMNSARQMCHSKAGLSKLRRTNSNTSQRVARKQLLRTAQDMMEGLKSTLDEMALTGPEFICNNIDEKFCRSKFDGRYTNRVSKHKSILPAMLKIYASQQ